MTYVARPHEFSGLGHVQVAAKPARKPFAWLRRIYDAVMASREWHANRELTAFFRRSGGRLTDDMEREMMRRLCTGDWNTRR